MPNYTTSYMVNFGKRILPITMVGTFSADEWETFFEEWLDKKKRNVLRFKDLVEPEIKDEMLLLI